MTGLKAEPDVFTERWIEYKGMQTGFIYTSDLSGSEQKIYVTERQRPFKLKEREGFSISKAVLHIAQQAGVSKIRVLLKRNERIIEIYTCSLDKWFREGETNFYKIIDEQLFIPLEKFDAAGK